MSKNNQNFIQLKNQNISMVQLNQELDKYLYELAMLFRKTDDLQEKVKEALKGK